MKLGTASWSLSLYVLLVFMCGRSTIARNTAEGHRKETSSNHVEEALQDSEVGKMMHMDHMDHSLKVFFTISDLQVGKIIPIYFPHKDLHKSPHLLPKEEADSIPFSSSALPTLLKYFSFSETSPQAKAMENTLKVCELEPIEGETAFCAASLESMLDFLRGVFGFNTHFKVLTTTHLSNSSTQLQNYTILEEPKEIFASKMVACHTMPYPYAVFFCHGQENKNKVFQALLGGEDGDRVEAVAVCHMDTSKWDSDHVAFRVLSTRPGSSPVCHFFSGDNLVWVPSSSISV